MLYATKKQEKIKKIWKICTGTKPVALMCLFCIVFANLPLSLFKNVIIVAAADNNKIAKRIGNPVGHFCCSRPWDADILEHRRKTAQFVERSIFRRHSQPYSDCI